MSEKDFQAELVRLAPLFRCKIVVIPDIPPLNRYGRVLEEGEKPAISRKLPFDCVLVTWRQNYLIECKYNYGQLKPHQKKYMQEVNTINNSYFVIRKTVLKKGTMYMVERNFLYSTTPIISCLFHTKKIEDLFSFFSMPEEYVSQKSMDSLIPEKKKPKLRKVRI